MQIGENVVIQKFYKNEHGEDAVRQFDGIFIGGSAELLSAAYFEPAKANLLGSVDWRLAFDRLDSLKHLGHEDVKAGKEGFSYTLPGEIPGSEPVEE